MKIRFTLLFSSLSLLGLSQTLPVGTPLLEESWRRSQVMGETNSEASMMIRPIISYGDLSYDSLYQKTNFPPSKTSSFPLPLVKSKMHLLPVTLNQQYNFHHPYGWNDGSMIPAKGYQTQLSFGFYSSFGPVSVQFRPELVYAQNLHFHSLSILQIAGIVKNYYETVANQIDEPERMGHIHFLRRFPGQSSVRLNIKKFSLGLSSENLWWGPGMRNSLLMSNNAPGFPHITFNTSAPLKTPIGSIEGQVISGLLKKSNYSPLDTTRKIDSRQFFDPKPDDDRYINGAVVVWQPKWTKGLYLGLSRVYYSYLSDVKPSLNGYLPVLSQLFKGGYSDALAEDAKKRDQMLSFYFRLLLPKEKAEIYAEYGKNDHANETRDLLLEPEHSSAYLIGLRKIFEQANHKKIELFAELTHLEKPSTMLVRAQGSWYSHYQVRDGYTHKGQVLGAGIGPGSNSQTLAINLVEKMFKTGLQFERVVRNNDFFYATFVPVGAFGSHWVDVSVQLNKSWQHKHILFDARLVWIKSFNYLWLHKVDASNVQTAFSMSYIF